MTDWSLVGADRLLEEISSQAPISFVAFDADAVCTMSFGAGLALVNLEPGQLVGSDLRQMYAADRESVAVLDRVLAGERVRTTFTLSPERSVYFWGAPLLEEGRVVGGLGFSLDVTAQLDVERERDEFRALVEASPQFIGMSDLNGHITYVNPGGREMMGMPPDLDITDTTWDQYVSAAEAERVLTFQNPVMAERGRFEGEGTLRHWTEGRDIPVHITTFALRDRNGRATGLATIRSDISPIAEARGLAEESSRRQQILLLHLHQAQDVERRRIAGDVHDDTIQVLAAVNLRLQVLHRLVAAQTPPDVLLQSLKLLDESVRAASARLRSVLVELDPPPVSQVGIAEQLEQRAADALADVDAEPSVQVAISAPPDETVGRILLRVAQEALTNVRKHAAARSVTLSLSESDLEYILRVEDDGRGLDDAVVAPGHLGIRSMVDRAESVGGRCSVVRRPGGGTLVEAVVPVSVGHPEQLQAQSARLVLEQTMAQFSESYLAVGNDWRIVFANAAAHEHLQRDPADHLVGRSLWEVFDESSAPEFAAAYRRAWRDRRQVTVTAQFGDTGRWMQNRVIPTPSGLSIFGRDVTQEVRLAEEAATQGQLIEGGRRVLDCLISVADPEEALRRALEAAVQHWSLDGIELRVSVGGGGDSVVLSAGDTSGSTGDVRDVRTPADRKVAELALYPHGHMVQPAATGLFALRIAADFS